MQFFTIRTAPIDSSDVVFREAWATKLFPLACATIATGVTAWMWWRDPSWFGAIFPVAGALFMWITSSFLRHAAHSSNWLMRCQTDGLLIKYRSYLNEKLPEDDDVIVRIDFKEIESAGKTSQWRRTPGVGNTATQSSHCRFLDLKLKSVDLSQLESKLQAERERPVRFRFEDFPVSVEQGMIRLAWKGPSSNIRPAIDAALAHLERECMVAIRPEVEEKLDLASDPKDREQQEAKLRQLLQMGNRIGAVKLARMFHGLSLADAVKFVDELAARAAPSAKESDQA